MRVLLAFDKFKDALSAEDACAVAADALRTIHPTWELDLCPLTDGGEGFSRILTRAIGGALLAQRVTGPRGALIDANFGLVPLRRIPPAAQTLLQLPLNAAADARLAIVEMAAASGVALLPPPERDPWSTHTFGTGELMLAAAQAGAAALLLGVGGSATNDLGAGALAALGLRFLTSTGQYVSPPIPAAWPDIVRLAGALPPTLPAIRIACDVTNPLLGPRGCATVFGPQKGLAADDVPRMERASARLARLLCSHCDQPDSLANAPGAGAAGGISFGLMAATQAVLLPGFSLVSAWLDLDARIAAADLVITGEGRFDATSLDGKGPGAIVVRARQLGRECHVFAGAVHSAGSPALHAISPSALPLADALRATRENLRTAIIAQFS